MSFGLHLLMYEIGRRFDAFKWEFDSGFKLGIANLSNTISSIS